MTHSKYESAFYVSLFSFIKSVNKRRHPEASIRRDAVESEADVLGAGVIQEVLAGDFVGAIDLDCAAVHSVAGQHHNQARLKDQVSTKREQDQKDRRFAFATRYEAVNLIY